MVLIAFVFLIFILVYLRFTSEFMSGSRFKKLLIVFTALFLVTFVTTILLNRPPKARTRISVIPFVDDTIDQSEAWLSWAIASQADDALRQLPVTDYLVYPVRWVIEAIDFDSLANEAYLYRYANRIDLDYLVLVRADLNCPSCPVAYGLVRLKDHKALFEGELDLPRGNRVRVGKEIGLNVVKYFQPSLSRTFNDTVYKTEVLAENAIKARLSLQARDYQQAISFAEKAFGIDSSLVPVRNLLAEAYLDFSIAQGRLGKPEGLPRAIAYKICERTVVNLGVHDSETHRLIGKYYLLRKMWGKAEEHFRKAIDLDPDNVFAYCDYSHLHRSRMKRIGFRNQEEVLRWAIYLNPCFEKARILLADYLYFNKWPRRAEKELDMLLYIHPTSIDGLLAKGKMAVAENDIDKIVEIYQRILDLDPNNAEAYYNLGVYYFNLGSIDTAEKFFNRAVRVGNYVDAHLYLGHIYEEKGLRDKAIEEYRLRIRYKRGLDDPYADEARKRLFNLVKPDTSLLKLHGVK